MIEPLGTKIVCLREEAKGVTDGGIMLPDTVKERERPQQATVVAIGPGKPSEAPGKYQRPEACIIPIHGGALKVGDKLLIGRYAGVEVEHERVKYLVIDAEDVLARIKA